MSLASAEVGVNVDTREGVLTRKRGFELDASVRYYPPLLDNADGFTKARAEARADLGSTADSAGMMASSVTYSARARSSTPSGSRQR